LASIRGSGPGLTARPADSIFPGLFSLPEGRFPTDCATTFKGSAMSIMNFFKGELLEVLEWADDTRDTIA
jgi:hypothetical protein